MKPVLFPIRFIIASAKIQVHVFGLFITILTAGINERYLIKLKQCDWCTLNLPLNVQYSTTHCCDFSRSFWQAYPRILNRWSLIQCAVVGFLCGLLWFQMKPTEEKLGDRMGLVGILTRYRSTANTIFMYFLNLQIVIKISYWENIWEKWVTLHTLFTEVWISQTTCVSSI